MAAATQSSRTAGNTIRLHRVLPAPPSRVYRALTDPLAVVKWQPPHGFLAQVHEMDVRVGGSYRMSFINLGTGAAHSFGGKYMELVPDEKIVCTDRFDDPSMPGELRVTITLKKVSMGTELNIVQENVPTAIPPDACYLGWQQSLSLLEQLVTPEIP